MIYLVTLEPRLFSSPNYQVISVEESLSLLEPLKYPELDTETKGFDPYTCPLLTVQLGCYDFQVVIDCSTIDITLYKEYLESDRTFILWNAKFDLRFFFHKGIIIRNVYDGYLAEKLMWLGYPSGTHGMSLKDAGYNYLGVELDKSVRGKIQYMGLTDEVIVYAATDVKYMGKIREKQLEELKKKGLLVAIQYENKFVPILAYTEYCGVYLDIPRWQAKMKRDSEALNNALEKLDKAVVDRFPNSQWVEVNLQGDLFSGFDTTPHCVINWSSPKQVIPFFEALGFDLTTRDKKTGETKKSVESDIIEAQKDKCPEIAIPYLDYKGAQKVCSTYGQNVINQINPISNRLHTNFNQLGCDTGRLSSGGKDKANKVDYLNFQNFPADPETRACFISGEGYTWISCDYSGQESRIIADVTNDPALIDLFNNGCGDVHSLTAKMSYPDVIGDTPVEEIKSKFKHYRQEAKGIEFAINYGGNANTIANNKNIPIQEANKIYNDYMKGFKGIKSYQDRQRRFVMDNGYILLNPLSGHKAFIYDFKELQEDKEWMKTLDWDYYREMKATNPKSDTVQRVKHFFKRKSASEKQSINYPCQGTGAVMFKLASIYLWKYMLEHDLVFKVRLCIPAHDEWNICVPNDMAESMLTVLQDCMSKAGAYFCKKVPLPAEGEVGLHWIH